MAKGTKYPPRTHCRAGHAMAGENVRIDRTPAYGEYRKCRACERERERERRQRRKQRPAEPLRREPGCDASRPDGAPLSCELPNGHAGPHYSVDAEAGLEAIRWTDEDTCRATSPRHIYRCELYRGHDGCHSGHRGMHGMNWA